VKAEGGTGPLEGLIEADAPSPDDVLQRLAEADPRPEMFAPQATLKIAVAAPMGVGAPIARK